MHPLNPHDISNRSYSSCVRPNTIMSSDIFRTLSNPSRALLSTFWNISAADEIPKLNLLYLPKPTCVVNVVMLRDSLFNCNWWYPFFKSHLENTFEPFKSKIISSNLTDIRTSTNLIRIFRLRSYKYMWDTWRWTIYSLGYIRLFKSF